MLSLYSIIKRLWHILCLFSSVVRKKKKKERRFFVFIGIAFAVNGAVAQANSLAFYNLCGREKKICSSHRRKWRNCNPCFWHTVLERFAKRLLHQQDWLDWKKWSRLEKSLGYKIDFLSTCWNGHRENMVLDAIQIKLLDIEQLKFRFQSNHKITNDRSKAQKGDQTFSCLRINRPIARSIFNKSFQSHVESEFRYECLSLLRFFLFFKLTPRKWLMFWLFSWNIAQLTWNYKINSQTQKANAKKKKK